MTRRLRTVIEGDDVGSLALALGLLQNGVKVELRQPTETAEHDSRVIHITPDATAFLDRLGVKCREFSQLLSKIRVQGKDGSWKQTFGADDEGASFHHPWYIASSTSLRTALLAKLSTYGKQYQVSTTEGSRVETSADASDLIVLPASRTTATHSAHVTQQLLECESTSDVLQPTSTQSFVRLDVQHADNKEVSSLYSNDKLLCTTYALSNDPQNGSEAFADPDTFGKVPVFNGDPNGRITAEEHVTLPDIQNMLSENCLRVNLRTSFTTSLASYTISGALRQAAVILAVFYDNAEATTASTYVDLCKDALAQLSCDGFDARSAEELIFSYSEDVFEKTRQMLRERQWSAPPTKYWRQPIEFGPMPGPRQQFNGAPYPVQHSTFQMATIKFKTDRTALECLLAAQLKDKMRLSGTGSLAYASFTLCTFRNLDWLGGRGYRLLRFEIQDAEYRDPSHHAPLKGTYIPVLFENLADPILSGREELGMPKLYSALDVSEHGSHRYEASADWEGSSWGTFEWQDLEETKDFKSPSPSDGIFCYRHQPCIGKAEKCHADASYPVLIPSKDPSCQPRITRIRKAATAKFTLDPHDWCGLPTMHHIISRLHSLPMYGIVGAYVMDGEGVPDASTTYRIDR